MTSPESEKGAPEAPPARPRRRVWPLLSALAVLVPIALTAIGRLTSPPTASGPPVGHIVYMEADEPSEHTSLLRGLRELSPNGHERELTHETEPQDVDSGVRTWINQPCGSPDGRWVAYEQQNITIGEEKQSVTYALWAVPLREPGKPRLLLDITHAKLKPFVGLAWTPDSRQVVFLNDAQAYLVDVQTGRLTHKLLDGKPPVSSSPNASATRNPMLWTFEGDAQAAPGPDNTPFIPVVQERGYKGAAGLVQDAHGVTQILFWQGNAPGNPIRGSMRNFPAQWGWSVWGHRKVTNVRLSPDGNYVAYSVSKPPFENELFYVDTATGKCRQLPVRTGAAAWDWTP